MSNKTLYFCDKCGKEVKFGELTHIKLELDPYSSYKTIRFETTYKYLDICDDCTEKLGFVKREIKEEKTTVEQTTADKLYDLIAQMILEQQT